MIGLSKSTLAVYKECPRCFWLSKVAKLEQPKRPFPGIVNGIDNVMKTLVGWELLMKIPSLYMRGSEATPYAQRDLVATFQSWRTFQAVFDMEGVDVKAWGELDDLLQHKDGSVSPWDFKSKEKEPEDAEAYSLKYYQLDADMYHLLLEAQGLKCSGFGYFTYLWPRFVEGEIQWDHKTVRIPSDAMRARRLLVDATLCLQKPIPPSSPLCEMCRYVSKRREQKV